MRTKAKPAAYWKEGMASEPDDWGVDDDNFPRRSVQHMNRRWQLNAQNWPTVEDRLDVFARSIVATCRSVIAGTAVCRSLGELYLPDSRADQQTRLRRKQGRRPHYLRRLRTLDRALIVDTRSRPNARIPGFPEAVKPRLPESQSGSRDLPDVPDLPDRLPAPAVTIAPRPGPPVAPEVYFTPPTSLRDVVTAGPLALMVSPVRCAHRWHDPLNDPANLDVLPFVGDESWTMKAGRTYVCVLCRLALTLPQEAAPCATPPSSR